MISQIAKQMLERPSSIREIMTLVAEYEKHPEKFPKPLIYLAGGWPQDPPPEVLRAKLREVVNDDKLWIKAARYSPTIGYPDLIELIPEYEYRVFGRRIYPQNVVFGLGSSAQTSAIFKLLLDPGDEIILTRPGYLNYTRQIDLELHSQVKIKYWPIIEDLEFRPSIDALNDMLTNKTKAVLVCSPGNPDGAVWNDSQLRAMHDLAEDHNFYVIIDAAYRAFIWNGDKKPLEREPLEREIWICSFSKEFRTPGWRASYVVVPEELKRPLDTIEQARTLAPVSLVQMIIIRLFSDAEALKELKRYYDSGARKYAEISREVTKELQSIEDIGVLNPQGGFYVFFDVSAYSNDDKKIWRDLIDKEQLALAPGSDFNGAKGWLRLSFAPVVETPQVLREGISRLKQYFSGLKARQ
ncbi:MAG: pyridoxal phosphate-dependent aminotransferase [Crenarchaeota archaeon]|nr:pyridoxal phosphate-dependent aminotransferase [Thermoproteota archaeon]MCR8453770.1 pyridoxal phosphate-dependent aminotransferase [Thermoproteota archaeon]MCR8455130.1 pyridoxal phosphate-dependent aminotransferase [Thermoproteota archaeon]MCR8462844.1 pyridoxal phosphate-dependent aminotransferase [Thermoproteota archaeon]MCR8470954.1 pyridoxal phosphate-dependent aminotransferase [Thermoproteota archaeon]